MPDMRRQRTKPKWSVLYLLFLLMAGLLGLVEFVVEEPGVRRVLQVLVTVAFYGLVAVWLQRSRVARDADRARSLSWGREITPGRAFPDAGDGAAAEDLTRLGGSP